MRQPPSALLERLREARADALAREAAVLFRHACDLYKSADHSGPKAARNRLRGAHRVAARAERLTARSLLWRPVRPTSDEAHSNVLGPTTTTTEEEPVPRDHAKWLQILDSPPVADIDPSAPYEVKVSVDGGESWEDPHPTTGDILQLAMTEVLYAERSVEIDGDVVTVQQPTLLARYTPTH